MQHITYLREDFPGLVEAVSKNKAKNGEPDYLKPYLY